MRLVLSIFILLAASGTAKAHLGHVGELAGHSHWIAVGAGLAAAAIAAWLGKRKLDAEAGQEEQEGEAEGEEEAMPEAARAGA